jgi:hypothetical protein
VLIHKSEQKKNVPKSKRNKTEEHEIIVQHSGLVSVTKWSDRKIITVTTTIRDKEIAQPISVLRLQSMHWWG